MSSVEKFVAWGQYVHWADLQFARHHASVGAANNADAIGLAAHWLAAEYIVLEGWRELKYRDPIIEALLDRYPEHEAMLRRCRNAVYHFQPALLDKRITSCLEDKNEELRWVVALHFEFQRYFLRFPYTYQGAWEERYELAQAIRGCVGWHPKDTPTGQLLALYEKCLLFEKSLDRSSNPQNDSNRKLIADTLTALSSIETEPLSRELSRMKINSPSTSA